MEQMALLITKEQFCLFTPHVFQHFSFLTQVLERFFSLLNLKVNGRFIFLEQVLVPAAKTFLKASGSFVAVERLVQSKAQTSGSKEEILPEQWLYDVLEDLLNVERLSAGQWERCDMAKSRGHLKVKIMAGRTDPHVFMQASDDGSTVYINADWLLEAEHVLNDVTVDRPSQTDKNKDLHLSLGVFKLIHELLHCVTPLLLDLDAFLKQTVLERGEETVRLKATPITVGSREDTDRGVIGDFGFVGEELMLGGNQRLYARRERQTPGEQFWNITGLVTETLLFDFQTKKAVEGTMYDVTEHTTFAEHLLRKTEDFNFARDLLLDVPVTRKRKSSSLPSVEGTRKLAREGIKSALSFDHLDGVQYGRSDSIDEGDTSGSPQAQNFPMSLSGEETIGCEKGSHRKT